MSGVGVRAGRAAVVVAVLAGLLGLSGVPETAAVEPWDPALGGGFRSVSPSRLVDTRAAGQGPCVSGTRTVAVSGVPADVSAAVLNVTVTGATAPGYATVWAAGSPRPGTSSVNYTKGATVPNSVVAGVGAEGLSVYASGGCPHLVVDLVGYFEGGPTARGGAYEPSAPTRLVDTRKAGQGPCVSGTRTVDVPAVPAGAAGAVLNVTVTGPAAPGYVTVWAAGSPRPGTSSVNYERGATVANGITSAVGADGLSVFASGGCPHVVIDLVGWFTPEGPVLEGSYVSTAPSRLVDTRKAGQGPCVAGSRVVEVPGVPDGVGGVAVNVTVTGSVAPGYVQVYAEGSPRPSTSVVNFERGQTTANGATTAIGPGGLRVHSSGGCPHVIVDLVGFYSGEPEPLTGVVDVSVGGTSTCALIDDGTVRCWGSDEVGSLGQAAPGASAFPVPVVGVEGVVSIDTGVIASCAVLADTTVTCWGFDWHGPEENSQPATPVPGLSDVQQVVVGFRHACALLDPDEVWCWGATSTRLNLPGASDGPVPVVVPDLTDVIEITSGWSHACARHSDGSVTCWGSDLVSAGDPYVVPNLDDAVAIDGGDHNTCALRADGTVWCWGYLRFVTGDDEVVEEPVQIAGVSGVEQLDGAADGRCVLHSSGDVSCFAVQFVADLLGADSRWTPVIVPGLADVEAVAAGWGTHACALIEGGIVRCWGRGVSGLLGNGSTDDAATPVTVIAGIAP